MSLAAAENGARVRTDGQELWRHESMQRAQESRAASRKAAKWKAAIGEIAELTTSFTTTYMRPLRESPWL